MRFAPDPPSDPDPTAVPVAVGGPLERIEDALRRVPLYPLLFAAYPVVLLYAENVREVPAMDAAVVLVAVISVTTLALMLTGVIMGTLHRAAIIVTAATLPFFFFGPAAEMTSRLWPSEPLVRAHLMVLTLWAGLMVVAFYAASKVGGRTPRLTLLLNVMSTVLIMLATLPLVGHAVATSSGSGVPSVQGRFAPTDVGPPQGGTRDIYHLVFDRYGSDLALQVGLGIDNSDFTDWLRTSGFQVAGEARANFERTFLSLAAVNGLTLHEELAVSMGPTNPDLAPLVASIRRSTVGQLLQRLGYHHYHLGSWFYPTAHSETADTVVEPSFEVTLASTLYDRSALRGIESIVGMVTTLSANGTLDRQAAVSLAQLDQLVSLTREPGPKYVFAHILLPHEPYLFLEDGTFAPHEATFRTQLDYVNVRIVEFVTPLLELPEADRPIIILQADEGPYPARYEGQFGAFDWSSAADEELVTKFGVLQALYLPGPEGAVPVPSDMSLVNTFPEILRRYFALDVPDLPDRVYTMRDGAVYDLVEATDRVREAFDHLAG